MSLWEELAKADAVLLMPIYKSREVLDESISSGMLAEKIGPKAKSVENFESLKNEILNLDSDYVVITMGAGNIDDLHKVLELKK